MHKTLRLVSLVTLSVFAVHCGSPAEETEEDSKLPNRAASAPAEPGAPSTPTSSSSAPAAPVSGDGADAGTDTDSGEPPPAPPAPPAAACDTSKPFAVPALLPGFALDAQAGTPRLSVDELTIYFTMQVAGRGAELGMATRTTTSANFGPATALTAQSSTANDNNPSVSADGLSLFFHSDRSGQNDLFFATRPTKAADFGVPSAVASLNTGVAESQIFYRAGGEEAWFVSPKGGTWDIYMAKRTAAAGFVFGTPTLVEGLSSPGADEWAPLPSEDGLSIVFISNRGAGGDFNLYMAKRASIAVPFGAPVSLDELNSPTTDYGGWVSPDGCRIYFSSTRGTPGNGLQRIWYSARPK